MFEVEHLKFATNATVSRCGMVWFSNEVVTINMIFNHYLFRLGQEDYDDVFNKNSENKQTGGLMGGVIFL